MQTSKLNTSSLEAVNETTSVNTIKPLARTALLFFGLSAVIAAVIFIIQFEVKFFNHNLGEDSIVGALQEIFLFITSLLFAAVAIKSPDRRGFAVLVAGFFVVLQIREHDQEFDVISHGFWLYPALIVTFASIGYALKNKSTTVQPLINYTKQQSFVLMLTGMVLLLVFSRIFGMSELWKDVMDENYVRAVKTTVEEGTELVAYSVIIFAAAWYCLPLIRNKTGIRKKS